MLGAVALLLLLSGCAQIAVHSTVTADGEIEEYRVDITMTRQAYGFLENTVEDEGYDNVSAYLFDDANASVREQVNYEEEFDGDEVHIQIQMSDIDPPASSSISVRTEGDEVVYEDTTFLNESASETDSEVAESIMSGLAVDYYLTMPGEITDTNADSVDGDTAEWHSTGSDAMTTTRVYARSEKPTGITSDGFGTISAGVALALVASIYWLRTRGE